MDIILSTMAIIILIPVFLIIAIIVWIGIGRPILFSQERIGKGERIFKLHKFRSMTNAMDENGNLLSEEKRLTRTGAFLRTSSLDELPELFSILTGKMSFVGPRPLPTYYGPYFHENERLRHKVRGGLIPPDSLSGKSYTTWEEQFGYEIYYADHVSFVLDVKVIFKTFAILLKRMKTNYGSDFRSHLNVYRADEIESN